MPLNRLDPNAIALFNLYPLPTNNGTLFSNYGNSPKLGESRNSFDTRMDVNFSEKNQLFYRFSYVDDPQFIPGIFGGMADGGGFQQGNQTALAQQSALAYTHVFSPTMVNVARAGLNYLHTTRVSPSANDLSDIPGQFGIAGIPQLTREWRTSCFRNQWTVNSGQQCVPALGRSHFHFPGDRRLHQNLWQAHLQDGF